jgi:hypothetical protein
MHVFKHTKTLDAVSRKRASGTAEAVPLSKTEFFRSL